MMLAVATLFVACSDDDESWGNPANATVEMGTPELSIKENKGIVNIPVKVTGEKHGRIQVTVNVTPKGENGAQEDVNYLITSKTIVIAADDNEGNIEFMTVDDEDINENREFEVSIASVKGATIAENATPTLVVLRDNDAEFYDKLTGNWTMTYGDGNGNFAKWNVQIIGAEDESDPDYNKYLYVTGIMGYSWTTAIMSYEFDRETNTVHLSWLAPVTFATEVDFGVGDLCDVVLYNIVDDEVSEESYEMELSDDMKSIKFPENAEIFGAVFQGDNYLGYWFDYYVYSLDR